ncbi:NFX1-type zinc finger-containing protein 1 [Leucoagaricus sp. SymC.cos]|nr:NFX1-type zinc finger-containing protein 1 [Leucoagaricus sp. SymC.cos]
MSQRQARCKLFNTSNGCRFGDRCKFSHVDGGTNSSRTSLSSAPSPARTPVPQSPQPLNKGLSGVPRNVCQFFWTSGACARGFECSYRHIKQADTTGVQSQVAEVIAVADEDDIVDFFSPEGLAIGAGSLLEDRHNLNPSEVHNHLKDFLRDNYRFCTAAQVTGFVRLLASVNDRNKAWGNALHRIGDVLRFEQVNMSIGFHTGALSFQRGYFPILQFFSSNLVLKSTMHKNINILYAVIKNNHEYIFATLRSCLEAMMVAKSWKDYTPNLMPSLQNTLDGLTIFRTLTTTFLQYFQRYKDAIRDHSGVPAFVQQFAEWFDIWASDVSTTPPRFQDVITSAPDTQRRLAIDHISGEIDRLLAIVERESGVVLRLQKSRTVLTVTHAQRSQARTAQLAQTYEPPGELRTNGPRHDNDFKTIENIRIAPTHSELFSPVAPYMPVFSPDAPHHLPAGSMERHLDIQFRLLREELISTTRASVTAIHDDLLKRWEGKRQKSEKTKLETILEQKGGAYRSSGRDSLFFHVYTNVEFLAGPPVARHNGVTVTVIIDVPPNAAARDKSAKKRFEYWEHSRRLQGSSLVALIIVSNRNVQVYLGVIASFGQDIAESSKFEKGRIHLRVSFFDSEVEFMALRGERLNLNKEAFAVLVDNGVMFESVRPILQKLQTIEPTEIPFSQYIARGGSLEDIEVLSPKYARAPGFMFNLQCLARPQMTISNLNISDPVAVARARDELKRFSVLDPSQAEAVVDTLTREVSLIQGPPGTGKASGTMIIHADCSLILLIAFTNHALDHMVTSVLDANITENIVRLGARSSDERISQYTLDKLERLATAPTWDRPIKRQYGVMQRLKEQMVETMTSIRLPLVSWEKIEEYLAIHHPEHADRFRMPPFWIQELADLKWQEEEELGEFKEVKHGKKGKKETVESSLSKTFYGLWRQGFDLQFIQQKSPLPLSQRKEKQREDTDSEAKPPASLLTNPTTFFALLGFDDGQMPPIPSNDRQLVDLLNDAHVWSMSTHERLKLAEEWERRTRDIAYATNVDQYTRVKEEYKEACREYDDKRNEIRRRILSNTDLIACTTTGAASLTSLLSVRNAQSLAVRISITHIALQSIAPKVLMVEEAGQVLEAHILSGLVSSVHHLICIGDPRQLRPSLATYTLSTDSTIGNELYKFDRSLMERLSDSKFPMSQINVQRRMRPTISHFVRTILYSKLEDNELVLRYPAVQGMQKDVFFFNHLHKENGTEDSVSKFNTFEVEMIRDLVMYFLHQGTYDGPGDIAVLCAYLGQLQKVRVALRNLKIAVSVNERDAEQLARQGIDEDVKYEEVLVGRHEEEELGEFKEVKHGKKGKKETVESSLSKTFYGLWRQGFDLQFIQQKSPLPLSQRKEKQREDTDSEAKPPASLLTNPTTFFALLGFDDGQMPPIPSNDRQLVDLLNDAHVWSMSTHERLKLAEEWERRTRDIAYATNVDQYTRVKEEYKEACREYDDKRNEIRRRILSNTDLIACTTTGAASLTSLLSVRNAQSLAVRISITHIALQSIAPKVLMVEEAGQVLEAHILSGLVSSVHHLICIGDPRQLRPSLATYTLSTDSTIGNELYKFDRSLMERLSDSKFPMSQINVQRRMRPTISHFVRTILYSKLEDNELVLRYPAVQGMQKDVFFFNHLHKLYKFDRSLMERLSDSKFPMSQINVQRRMRPTISHFVRTILYSKLEDNELVLRYPAVQGMQKDVFFFNHLHKENGTEDSVSKFNTFEVEMIRDLVMYFLHQGTYDGPGDIAVLCAYLGQLQKVRVALRNLKIAVSVNERDAEQLARQGIDEDVKYEEVLVGRHVRLGTVDIFQGQEAKIVIVSLVRNSGQIDTGSASIGFLKSPNRINVALSRAKHGLYVLGNASNLRQNPTWSTILDEMEARDQIGPAFPLICPRHPEQARLVSKPGEIPLHAPSGGCTLPCDARLSCGHVCPSVTITVAPSAWFHVIAHRARESILALSGALMSVATAISQCIKYPYPVAMLLRECLAIYSKISGLLNVTNKSESNSLDASIWQSWHVIETQALFGARNRAHSPFSVAQRRANPLVPVVGLSPSITLLLRRRAESHALTMLPILASASFTASIRQQEDIVDFIMQRRLMEIDLTSIDVSERLITLACGHIFTVETLDGHCNMSAFYEIDEMGQFLSTKTPPVSYQRPPTCPTCRGPITALRYGRVTKRATLDILEQNVAGTMSSALGDCSPVIAEFTSTMPATLEQVRKLEFRSNGDKVTQRKSEKTSYPDVHGPLPANTFDSEGIQKFHGIPLEEAHAWYKIVKPIVLVYRRILKVANTRGAHVKAYEAAVTTLYRLELQAITNNPGRVTNTPEYIAHAIAQQKIGQPPPRADVRFQIEAYFLSLEVRALIAQLAQERVEALPLTATAENPDAVHRRGLWASFVTFLYKSCVIDAEKAVVLATNSSASRQAVRASTHKLRFEFELFRWEAIMQRSEMVRVGSFDLDVRDELLKNVKEYKHLMLQSSELVQKTYLQNLPSTFKLADILEERQWLDENCQKKVNAWQNECEKLEVFIVKGGPYQPLSTQELTEIVRSFGFPPSGHFFNCRNGHTFVITECGGAVQSALCPECKAPIGGTGYRLTSNTRNEELEAIPWR